MDKREARLTLLSLCDHTINHHNKYIQTNGLTPGHTSKLNFTDHAGRFLREL